MTKKNTTQQVTRKILKEEISASENRLTAKIGDVEKRLTAKIGDEISGVESRLGARIETTAQSLKDYTDSRFNRSDARTDSLDAKMTKYFELMMQTITNGNMELQKILFNHEGRITALEAKSE